jgi:hypothetical protein
MRSLLFAACAGSVMTLAACVTFIGLNPFLYYKPLQHLQAMYTYRMSQMMYQFMQNKNQAIENVEERLRIVPERIFNTYASLSFPGAKYLNIALCIIGGIWLVRRSLSWMRREPSVVSAASLAIAVIGVFAATPALFTPLDWARYYVFPVLFSTMGIAIGMKELSLRGYRWYRQHGL